MENPSQIITFIQNLDENICFVDVAEQLKKHFIDLQIEKNNNCVYKNILIKLNRQLNIEKIHLQKKHIVVTNETICFVCGEKIRNNTIINIIVHQYTNELKISHIYHNNDY